MLRTCERCGQTNRIPARHLADTGKCGACKAALPAADRPLDVGAADFDEIVREARVPVLVDFWAAWCGPCRMIAPVLEQLAQEYAGRATIAKLDTDANPATTVKYGVRSLPSVLFFLDGKLVDHVIGAVPRVVLESKIRQHLPAT